jgi:hypothetical protein
LPFAGEAGFAAAGGLAGEVEGEGGVEVWDEATKQAALPINPSDNSLPKIVRTFINRTPELTPSFEGRR